MQSYWNDAEAEDYRRAAGDDPDRQALALRVYTSRLLGREPDLVLHGGGNTSVKVDGGRIMHVKGSGWDLATIEAPGLPGLRLAPLLDVRHGGRLSDPEMVDMLRANMIDPSGPNPSVETLLHAFLPARYVDHTHSAATLAIANQPDAAERAREIFGDRLAIVPYVMPGFDLAIEAAACFDRAPGCEGLFLVNHGLFSFDDDARVSYEKILGFTSECEDYLAKNAATLVPAEAGRAVDADLRAKVFAALGAALRQDPVFAGVVALDLRANALIDRYLALPNLAEVVRRGTITPDHVIRLKPSPLIGAAGYSQGDWAKAIGGYAEDYRAYFERHAPHASEPKTMLDPMPRLVLVQGLGIIGVGRNEKEARICADLGEQAARVVVSAEKLGRFTPITEAQLFEMEYWSLEQAKLKAA